MSTIVPTTLNPLTNENLNEHNRSDESFPELESSVSGEAAQSTLNSIKTSFNPETQVESEEEIPYEENYQVPEEGLRYPPGLKNLNVETRNENKPSTIINTQPEIVQGMTIDSNEATSINQNENSPVVIEEIQNNERNPVTNSSTIEDMDTESTSTFCSSIIETGKSLIEFLTHCF